MSQRVEIGMTERGWACWIVEDTAFLHVPSDWRAVVFDGVAEHRGPLRATPEAARADLPQLIDHLEALSRIGKESAAGAYGAN